MSSPMPIFRSDLIALFDALGMPNLGHAAPAAILTRMRGTGVQFTFGSARALPEGLHMLALELENLAARSDVVLTITENRTGPAKRLSGGEGAQPIDVVAQGLAEGIVAQAMKLAEGIVGQAQIQAAAELRAMSEMPSSRLDQLEKRVADLELFNSGEPE